jgi:hypothetical protein
MYISVSPNMSTESLARIPSDLTESDEVQVKSIWRSKRNGDVWTVIKVEHPFVTIEYYSDKLDFWNTYMMTIDQLKQDADAVQMRQHLDRPPNS